MTIQDFERFKASLPDWAILDGCFAGKIRPTDVDGLVERRGVCLFLEHKGGHGEVGKGQDITFTSLARQGNTCVVYWTDDEEKKNVVRILVYHGNEKKIIDSPSLAKLRECAKHWFSMANTQHNRTNS